MGELVTNRNCAQYYGGRIYYYFQTKRDILSFVGIMRKLEFILELQRDIQKVL